MNGADFFAFLTPIKVYNSARVSAVNYRICEFGSIPMMDIIMLAIAFVFFALSIAYVYACDLL